MLLVKLTSSYLVTDFSGFLLPIETSNPFEASRRAKPDPILPDPMIVFQLLSGAHQRNDVGSVLLQH
jgi:hypothetical protein